jgi:hypothetical protein
MNRMPKTQNVRKAADTPGRVKPEIRRWSGTSTTARDAPRRTISVTTQNTKKAKMKRMNMNTNKKRSPRCVFMSEYLLYHP